MKIDFKFTDRGERRPPHHVIPQRSDLTPQAFEIKGKTARPVQIDEAMNIDAG